MTSIPSSRLAILGLAVVVVLGAAAPAAAVSLSDSDVPAEAEAGTQVSATFTLTNLYQEPQWDPWTLRGETELQNVTWTITFINPQGDEFDTRSYDGQTMTQGNITAGGEEPITELRISVTGTVPEPDEYTYPAEETFVVAELTQTRGAEGSQNGITTEEAHHYTTGTAEEPGSREARQALNEARTAINEAAAGGADVGDANATLQNAISSYENGNFGNAIDLANTAEEEANAALEEKRSAEQRNQLLLYGAVGVVALVVVGGAAWWFRQQQGDDYDKLG